jgi:hypothetical protein
LYVDAAGKSVDPWVLRALRFVQAFTAGEDDICALEELDFTRLQLGCCPPERRELVHTVVHGKERLEVSGEFQRHGRVVPEDVPSNLLQFQKFVEKLALLQRGSLRGCTLRQMRHDHHYPVRSTGHV